DMHAVSFGYRAPPLDINRFFLSGARRLSDANVDSSTSTFECTGVPQAHFFIVHQTMNTNSPSAIPASSSSHPRPWLSMPPPAVVILGACFRPEPSSPVKSLRASPWLLALLLSACGVTPPLGTPGVKPTPLPDQT